MGTKIFGSNKGIATSNAIPDNTSVAFDLESTDAKDYITIDTTNGNENLKLGTGTRPDMVRLYGANGVVDGNTGNYGINTIATSSATVPNFYPNKNDQNTGLGHAGTDRLSLIAGGTEALRLGGGGVIGKLDDQVDGTFTATNGSAEITSGSSTAFTTDLHVGSAFELFEGSTSRGVFTVTAIDSGGAALTLDSTVAGLSSSPKTGMTGKTDSSELFAVKTGDSKTLFGVNETGAIQAGSAAADASASNNIAIGDSTALDAITTGTKNFILGTSSDNYKLTTGHSNVFAGYRAGEDCTGSNNSVIIGNQAGCVNNIGNNSTLVGAGAGVEATGNGNTALGMSSLYSCSSGSNNVGIGYSAGSALTGGTDCVMLGKEAQPSTGNGANQIAIGKGAAGHADNKATIGNANITSIDPHSDRGCDLGQVAYEFDAVHCVSVTEVSDERLKENISDTAMGLDFINALRPVSYKFKDIEHQTKTIEQLAHRQVVDDNGELVTESFTEEHEIVVHPGKVHTRHHQGLIAQEVKTVLDSMEISAADFGGFVDGNVVDGVDKLALRYTQFIGPLIKSVQELTSQNESLAARIATLEAGD